MDEKTNCWEILRNFSKNFLRKLRKIHYFRIFFRRFNKLCGNFSRVLAKYSLFGNFEKFFEKFVKEIANNAYSSISLKRLFKPCANFTRVKRKFLANLKNFPISPWLRPYPLRNLIDLNKKCKNYNHHNFLR